MVTYKAEPSILLVSTCEKYKTSFLVLKIEPNMQKNHFWKKKINKKKRKKKRVLTAKRK